MPPFINRTGAATNLQAAVDAAAAGDTVWVTNGIDATGGKAMSGDLTNCLALDKTLLVQSVEGPAAIGIFFGFYPARKAARLDPIEALRYE